MRRDGDGLSLFPILQALSIGMGGTRHANVEVKYNGPDGVMIDVSQTGWMGTSGSDHHDSREP